MISDQNSIDDIIKQAKNEGDNKPEEAHSSNAIGTGLSPDKIIDRLDDVTIQSEVEASKIVDLINDIINELDEIIQLSKEIKTSICNKIPEEKVVRIIDGIDAKIKKSEDMLFNAMNLLQYQDILRQKIEKIAAALSVFYNYLGVFLGKGMKPDDHRIKEQGVRGSKSVQEEIDPKKPSQSSHKIIDKLDDVSMQSEAEATKVADLIDKISMSLNSIKNITKDTRESIEKKANEEEITDKFKEIVSKSQETQDMLFTTMNLLQYQDILRQKVENIATSLGGFYDYLGDFLGKGKVAYADRATGKHVEDSTLERDQKVDEIDMIIDDFKK